MPDAAIEGKQLLVACREPMSHKFGPTVIATVYDLGDADIQHAAMVVTKVSNEAAQRGVDCQRTRLVNKTPALTADLGHSQSTAMAVTGSEVEFLQVTRVTGAENFQPTSVSGPTLREPQGCHAAVPHDRVYSR